MRTLSSLVLALTSITSIAAAQDVDSVGEAAMLVRINADREGAQLAPLERSADLDAVARAHSIEMAARNAVEHVSPVTGTPADRVSRAGITASTIAENVAMHRDTARAFEALVSSPGHRSNMMNAEVTHVGIASVISPQGVYVTQVFARIAAPAPAPEPVVEEAPAVVEEEPASIFQIIPPFVEQLIGAAQAAQLPAVPEVVAPVEAPAEPAVAAPAAEAPAAPVAQPQSVPPQQLSRETQDALRQIFGLAQSLLGGNVTVE